MNRPLLTKVASFLTAASKSEDGKVNRKKAGELAKQLQKQLTPVDVDHNQRNTGSHIVPVDPQATPTSETV